MDIVRIKELLEKYKQDQLSQDEWEELRETLLESNYDAVLREDIMQLLQKFETHKLWTPEMEEQIWKQVNDKIHQVPTRKIGRHKVHYLKNKFKWVAAAVVIVALGTGLYYFLNHPVRKDVRELGARQIIRDVEPPHGTHAVITLGDGQQIFLDSIGTGTLATQDKVNLVKVADGQIAYLGNSGIVMYNTLFNPGGSRVINLTLNDGTRVWLNSESSLRYPTAFTGAERTVEITGEAYFEVAKDPAKKFIVSCRGIKTEVLGTHFNFNAYENEADVKITLLEGKVKVSKDSSTCILLPGQQGQVGKGLKILPDVDMEEVMAWKNGKFQFGEATSIETVMRQIARWYNVQIEYRGSVSGHIGGTISRDVNVSEVFKILEMTGSIKYEINDKKIIIIQ